jgi:hypothetical protein
LIPNQVDIGLILGGVPLLVLKQCLPSGGALLEYKQWHARSTPQGEQTADKEAKAR